MKENDDYDEDDDDDKYEEESSWEENYDAWKHPQYEIDEAEDRERLYKQESMEDIYTLDLFEE